MQNIPPSNKIYDIMDDDIENDVCIDDYCIDISNTTFDLENDVCTWNIDLNSTKYFNFSDTNIQNDVSFSILDSIQMYLSNSPLSMSGNSSETEMEESKSNIKTMKKKYPKLTYEEIEYSIQKNYSQDKYSNELDILITFVKGQKHIYSQSNRITQQKINMLVFPCLIITSSIMVISPIISFYSWNGWFLSLLNAILTLFISLSNFLGLQHDLFKYKNYEFHFNRLLNSLILTRTQTYLMNNTNDKTDYIIEKIKEVEQRMLEMRESNDVTIPIEVESQVPIISHVDIFLFIRKIDELRKNTIVHYKDIKNEIRYIMFKWKQNEHIFNESNLPSTIEKQRLIELFKQKEIIKNELTNYYNTYTQIDELFMREIQLSEQNYSSFWYLFRYFFLCGFYRPKPTILIMNSKRDISNMNPVLNKYIDFIFSE